MDQQKQIRKWLKKEIPGDADRVFTNQSTLYSSCVALLKDKTPNQYKTLTKTILPRVALYKTLKEDEKFSAYAYEITRKYMVEVIGMQKHKSTRALEIIPGFYRIYSRSFLKIMRTTDLQKSTQEEGRDYYKIMISDCLWYNACKEFGCPELCPAFCDVDDITYGDLRKIGFTRTQTLGKGGECCDFHFFRK